MTNPFQRVFEGGRPQRRVLRARVIHDRDGNPLFQPLEGQVHLISSDDSLDTVNLDVDAFFDCGCPVLGNQPGCQCCEPGCPHVVCRAHAQRCQVCLKGLCLQCDYPLEIAPGHLVHLCLSHHQELKRRRRWERLAKTLLRPFVEFDGSEGAT
jgi:hypothetical protein